MGKVELILIIVAIILLLLGAKKLPQLARSIGDSGRELKKGLRGNDESAAQQASSDTSTKDK
jgi:sec-independent protein translocase protein TatA